MRALRTLRLVKAAVVETRSRGYGVGAGSVPAGGEVRRDLGPGQVGASKPTRLADGPQRLPKFECSVVGGRGQRASAS